jgi:DNA-binding GntR family transcriptional regulator
MQEMATPNPQDKIDFADVARLVAALEADLAKTRAGSGDLDTLRAEVEQLRVALHSGQSVEQDTVPAQLHGVRALLRRIENELIGDALPASEYITRIGRMLGL